MQHSPKQQFQLLCAGGAAGAVAKTCVSPLERTRILRQTGQAHAGVISTLLQIVRAEGWSGLWRGNLINCYRAFPSRGLLFSCNDLYKTQLAKVFISPQAYVRGKQVFEADGIVKPLPTWMSFAAGSLAGMTASTMTYPLDVARTRIAGKFLHGAGHLREKSGLLMLLHMARKEGMMSWYRGIGPTLLGAVPYEGLKFMSFDVYNSLLLGWVEENTERRSAVVERRKKVGVKLVCGALAGATAGCVLYPNDTVRRLLQIQGTRGAEKVYSSALDCWRKTYASGGIRRFYRGIVPYLIRMAPNSAIQFGTYEYLKSLVLDKPQE